MAKTSNYWDKRALKRLKDAEKQSEVYIKRVKRVYEQAYKDIDRQLASIYKNYSNETGLDTQKLKQLLTRSETKKTWEQMKRQGLDKYIKDNYKSRISRLEQLQAQIYAKAKMIYPKEELQNTMCYKGVINQSYYKTMYDTQMGTGYAFNFATIDNNMIDALLQDPWSGVNYSQRIWGNTDILADNLSHILGGAMLSGQSMELTAKQMRDRFNVSKYYAERLIRTETNHFNNEVDAMAYEEMGLDKYVFVATLDSRTSEICQAMDNQVFNYSEREEGVNYPPLHPNCRSKTRAYLGKEEEKHLQRRARNPITGKTEIINNMSYQNWIKQYQNVENNKKTVKTVEKTPQNNNKTPKTVENNKKIVKSDKLNILSDKLNSLDKPIKMADYDYKGLATKLKDNGYLTKDIMNTRAFMYEGEDLATKKLLYDNKYNNLPTVLDAKEYDKLDDNYIKVFRGVKDTDKMTAKEINEQFRSGELYIGNGLFGNGTYTAVNKEVAEHFGTDIMEIAIPKNARIVNYKDIKEEFTYTVDKPSDWKPINSKIYDYTNTGVESSFLGQDYSKALFTREESDALKSLLNDYTFQAVSCNYDVIKVEAEDWYRVLTEEARKELDKTNMVRQPYYVILNRGAVIVKKGG